MDILDILIAKKKSFTGETEKLTRQANEAMAKANEVSAKIDDATDALTAAQEAQEAAEAANTRAQTIADDLENMKEEVASAAEEVVAQATTELQTSIDNAVTSVEVENDNTSTYKGKKARVRKKNLENSYNLTKNYTTTGANEDGAMTQKAITDALNSQKTALETKINNIRPGSGSGNISGNITAADEGHLVVVDENGNLGASGIKETDIILTQITSDTYQNDNIIGLEIDYVNKTFTRLQGARNKTAGEDFNSYQMLGGRKRCIVDEDGRIERFLTAEDTLETIANKRIMVYQPPVYYFRAPLSVTSTNRGLKINKEQVYISDNKYTGFELHPIFKDENDNAVKYVLLPAYDSGTLTASGNFIKDDSQTVNFATDKLVSIAETKPISGSTQLFTYEAAEQMAHNNGKGWELTDLRFESLNQMLMIIEYGSLNIQNSFNKGISLITNNSNENISSISGSTHNLLNTSGQATETINITGETTQIYNDEGRCAISYRGMENPYGNIWRFIGQVSARNNTVYYNNEEINFKIPVNAGWINAFGYDENHNWIFLPIETGERATNMLPVGDYIYPDNNSNVENVGIAGGLANSGDNCGLFYYGFNIAKDGYHYRSDSARVMHIPTANSDIETSNYNLWLRS